MNRRIILWDSHRHASQSTDEAGTTIYNFVHPANHEPGPYESETNEPHFYVPSLAYFTLKSLFQYPDQIYVLGIRLKYRSPSSPLSRDILRELIPFYDQNDPDFNLNQVDPRLWATLVQVFSGLPDTFRTYHIPLSDKHVPLLQHIPSTPYFSLITILELPRCSELTDETIVELKHLSQLSALDASATKLSSHGITKLSRTLMWSEEGDLATKRRGPWALRILALQNCQDVDNHIFSCLPKFVLLSVIDLRGTRCNPKALHTNMFRPSTNKSFFHPSPLSSALALLSSAATSDQIFSSPDIYIIQITSLHYISEHRSGYSSLHRRRPNPSVAIQDAYVVLQPSQSFTKVKKEPGQPERHEPDIKPKIQVGNSQTLERRRQWMEEMEKHERNKEAWYERNDHWARDNNKAWPGRHDNWDPYSDGEPHSSMDEDGVLTADEDGTDGESDDGSDGSSEDDGEYIEDSDAIDLDLSLFIGPTLNKPNLDAQSASTIGIGSSTEGQLSPSTSQVSHPNSADRPTADSDTLGPGSPTGRHPRARRPWSELIRSRSIHTAGAPPNGQTTSSLSNISQSRQMALAASMSPTPDSSTVIDITRSPEESTSAPVPTAQLSPSRSMVLTERSHPNTDLRTSVASEEAEIYASRQAAAAFYLGAQSSTTSSANRIRRLPSKHIYRGQGRACVADEQLMLFRDPPPWSVLEDTNHGMRGKERDQVVAAMLDRSSSKGAEGMKELMQMAKRRRLAVPTKTRVSRPSRATTNAVWRNPFRGKSKPENVLVPISSDRATAPLRPPLATLPIVSRHNPMDGSCVERPSSTLGVPPPPLSALSGTQSSSQKSSEHKRRSSDVGGAKTSRTHGTNTSLPEPAVGKLKRTNSQPKAKSRGLLPSTLHSAADGNAPPRNKPKSQKVPATFDWKGWASKC